MQIRVTKVLRKKATRSSRSELAETTVLSLGLLGAIVIFYWRMKRKELGQSYGDWVLQILNCLNSELRLPQDNFDVGQSRTQLGTRTPPACGEKDASADSLG